MLLKKYLLVSLALCPFSIARANLPANCSIVSGVLSCTVGSLVNTGSLTLDSTTVSNGANIDGPLASINLAVSSPAENNIINAGNLRLIASGNVTIGGYVYNGVHGYDANGDITDPLSVAIGPAKTPDYSAKYASELILEGSAIFINGVDANGVALLNLSSRSGQQALSIKGDTISISGSVWNNVDNTGTAMAVSGPVSGIGLESENGIMVSGDFITFGGDNTLNNKAGVFKIHGDLKLGGSGPGNINTITSSGLLGNGSLAILGDVMISNGATTFQVDKAFSVGGDFTNNTSGKTEINASSLDVWGMLDDLSGLMEITIANDQILRILANSAGAGYAGGIHVAGGGMISIGGGKGMELGVDGLDIHGALNVGYAKTSNMNGSLEITTSAGKDIGAGKKDFEIISFGDITVGGALDLARDWTLNIRSVSPGSYIDVDFSSLRNYGNLYIGKNGDNDLIKSFSSGDISSTGISGNPANIIIKTADQAGNAANDITVSGNINNYAYSSIDLQSDDNLIVGGYVHNHGNTTDVAGTLKMTAVNGGIYIGFGAADNQVGVLADQNGNGTWDPGENVNIGGDNYTITMTGPNTFDINGHWFTNVAGRIGNDGYYYFDGDNNGIEEAYAFSGGKMVQVYKSSSMSGLTNESSNDMILTSGYTQTVNNITSRVKGDVIRVNGGILNRGGGKIAMTIATDVHVSGDVLNDSGGKMYFGWDWVDSGSTVGGVWTASGPDGVIDIKEQFITPIDSLTIAGTLTNKGSFHAEVSGATTLGGLDVTNATDFYLKTKTLSLKEVDYRKLLTNSMNNLHLELTGTGTGAQISVTSITNSNIGPNAGMFVGAESISTTGIVMNTGTDLYMDATQDISIGSHLYSQTLNGNTSSGGSSKMTLHSDGTISVGGNTKNYGGLTINGESGVNLKNVDNFGRMEILTAFANNTQKLTIEGYLKNNNAASTNLTPTCTDPMNCAGRDLYVYVNQLEVKDDFTNSAGLALVYFSNPGGAAYYWTDANNNGVVDNGELSSSHAAGSKMVYWNDDGNLTIDAGEVLVSHFDSIKITGGRADIGGDTGMMIVDKNVEVASGGYLSILGGLDGIATHNGSLTVAGKITHKKDHDGTPAFAGNLNINKGGSFVFDTGNAAITIGGGILFDDAGYIGDPGTLSLWLKTTGALAITGNVKLTGIYGRTLELGAAGGAAITIGGTGNVEASGTGNHIILHSNATMAGNLTQDGSGRITTNGSYLTLNGTVAKATIRGAINFAGGAGDAFMISGTNVFTFNAKELEFGGISDVSAGNTLKLLATKIKSTGAIKNTGALDIGSAGTTNMNLMGGTITNNLGGTLNIAAHQLEMLLIDNHGTTSITHHGADDTLVVGDIKNDGTMTVANSGRRWVAGAITASGGTLTMDGSLLFDSLNQTGGKIVWNGTLLKAANSILMTGNDITVGGTATSGLLMANSGATLESINLTMRDLIHNAGSATIKTTGLLTANEISSSVGNGTLNINANTLNIANGITNASAGATINLTIDADAAIGGGISNSGTMNIKLISTMPGVARSFGMITNTGQMTIDSRGRGLEALKVGGIENITGRLTLTGTEIASGGDLKFQSLYQGQMASTNVGSVSVLSADYAISVDRGKKITIGADPNEPNSIIGRAGNKLTLNTGFLDVAGGIDARNGTIVISAANYLSDCMFTQCSGAYKPSNPTYDVTDPNWSPWLAADIGGNVSGGTRFYGVGRMEIGGNYTFNDKSILSIAVLPNSNSNGIKFTSTIGIGGSGAVIADLSNMDPIIHVDGKMITDVHPLEYQTGTDFDLKGGNIGLTIFDAIMEHTVVWLLHAEQGIENQGFLPRDMSVYFCNADGTKCFNYLTSAGMSGVPAYIYQGSSDGSTNMDSLFAVFDPTYGGPILVKKIQPIIKPVNPDFNTNRSAGALDNWIYYGLDKAGFNPKNNKHLPIDAILAAYAGNSVFADMSQALYERMESEVITKDPRPLNEFSRLFVPTEAGQLSHLVNLSDRLTHRTLQQRMTDESLWTRNRVKQKMWLDVNFGMIGMHNQDGDGKINGTRMSAVGGYDVQVTPNTIIGANAGFSQSANTEKQKLDLTFGPGNIAGGRETTATDIGISVGGHIVTKIAESAQLYLFANMQSHTLSVDREQNYVGPISGSSSTSSIGGEFGIIHSISEQYIVGNVLARFAKNSGFKMTEKVGGMDYMEFQHDEYMTFAPGYSLMMQKRMYLSPTFIMRPYLSTGIEYEVDSMGDSVKYRFEPSDVFSEYKIETNPLWLTGKVGLEFLTIGGLQVGAGYEYHHNAAVKMHNLHLSASLRF